MTKLVCAFHEEHGNTFVLTMPCMSSSIQATITAPLIEKVVKQFKTHRAVIDFDNRFIAVMVKMKKEGISEIYN